MLRDRCVALIDCQSFYASVEKAARPELKNKPVAIGDPTRRTGIILAACPIAKTRGVTTAERVGEALAKCHDLVIIRPRMQTYIAVSLLITEIYESFTDLVEPFSIDEQFVDLTHILGAYGSPEEIARLMQQKVLLSTGVWTRVGLGPTKILAKMATDNFSKKMSEGLFTLNFNNIESDLWPLPVEKMFMVGSKMALHFNRMGLTKIGDIARMDLGDFKKRMRFEMRKQSDIQAEYYWQTANGFDNSEVIPGIRNQLKSINHGKVLRSSLYRKLADVEVVLLELVVEVCRRSRRHGYMGRVVSVGAAETDGERSAWFNNQITLPQPSSLTHEVAAAAQKLFADNWSGLPVSHLSISLNQLSDDSIYQLTLFDDRSTAYAMEKTTDAIKDRFGSTSIMRASSLLASGIARERAMQIGGHFK